MTSTLTPSGESLIARWQGFENSSVSGPHYINDQRQSALRSLITPRVWILSATVALVSTKYLLVDKSYHNLIVLALHLLLMQLLTLLAILFCRESIALPRIITSRLQSLSLQTLSSGFTVLPVVGRARIVAATLAISLALPLFAQAILHFPNLPTLSMLTILSSVCELFYIQASCGPVRQKSFALGIAVLLLVFIVVLYEEYRLTVNGLLFGLPAMALFGISRGIFQIYCPVGVPSCDVPPALVTWYRLLKITALISLATTLFWAIYTEDSASALIGLTRINPLLVALNIASTTTTLFLGGPIAAVANKHSDGTYFPPGEGFTYGFSLTGLTALFSLLLTRRAFSTALQIFAFCGASIAFAGPYSCAAVFVEGKRRPIRDGPARGERLSDSEMDIDPEPPTPIDIPIPSARTDLPGSTRDGLVYRLRHGSAPALRSLCSTLPGLKYFYSALTKVRSSTLPTMAVFLVWTLFIYLNFSGLPRQEQPNSKPVLDLVYDPPADFDIVISMYKESTDSVNLLVSQLNRLPNIALRSNRLLIYTKDEDADTEILKSQTNATRVVKRPNYGREGESYLYHIYANWDDLAEQTLFIQAHVHNSWEFFRRVHKYFSSSTGMMSLGFSGNVCDCTDCQDRWGWKDNSGILAQVYQEVYNKTCTSILLSYKGQFIVSARRIRGIDRGLYERLHDVLANPKSWAHQQSYLHGRPDSLNAPFFGFTLERLWSVIFQCSDLEIASKCPSLLSGTRRGGGLGDCQCFDRIL